MGITWWGWGGDGDEFYYRVILYRAHTADDFINPVFYINLLAVYLHTEYWTFIDMLAAKITEYKIIKRCYVNVKSWTLRCHPAVFLYNKLCGRPPQYAPAPATPTSDLESGVRVTCDMGYLCANLVFLGLSVLDLGPMCAKDRQTSDMHRRLMPPTLGAGHNNGNHNLQCTPFWASKDRLFSGYAKKSISLL